MIVTELCSELTFTALCEQLTKMQKTTLRDLSDDTKSVQNNPFMEKNLKFSSYEN